MRTEQDRLRRPLMPGSTSSSGITSPTGTPPCFGGHSATVHTATSRDVRLRGAYIRRRLDLRVQAARRVSLDQHHHDVLQCQIMHHAQLFH